MNKTKSLILVLSLCIFTISSQVFAKDLTHRLGVGFKNNTSESVPSLTVVYYASKDYAFTGGVGVDTKKNNSTMQANAGVRKMIYFENNLNFYMGAQLGFLSVETAGTRDSGVDMLAVFGTEFFFTGLENLGFTLEAGAGISTAKDTRFRTVADDPLRAGILFYF
ncbi:organic solvent tolerance protein [bacterium]|nr:organic solvent tolerance protein [bacterium]